jgi:hypothetical protein
LLEATPELTSAVAQERQAEGVSRLRERRREEARAISVASLRVWPGLPWLQAPLTAASPQELQRARSAARVRARRQELTA